MRINEELIAIAVKAIDEVGIVDKAGFYNKEFNGYISSLGAAIVQSGLLPAMIFFENKSENAVERPKVIRAIIQILNAKKKYQISDSIAKYILQNQEVSSFDKDVFLKEVIDAATALKLALRIYKKKEKKEDK